MQAARDYCAHSSLHGLHFITEPERHWTERLFWLCCCLLSWCGMVILMLNSWDAYVNNPISFITETLYKDWNTDFPSVSVCQTGNPKIMKIVDKIMGTSSNWDMYDVYKELAFFQGTLSSIPSTCFYLNGKPRPDVSCPAGNLSAIVDMFRSSCEDLFAYCYWNGNRFNCCEQFFPLRTEMGQCFTFNNVNTKGISSMKLYTNSSNKRGNFTLGLHINADVYIHSLDDIPNFNTRATMMILAKLEPKGDEDFMGRAYKWWFKVNEVENDPHVREVAVEERRCRFPDENYLAMSDMYSSGACTMQCRKDLQMRMCSCANPLMPALKPEEECNLKGMMCLSQNNDRFRQQRPVWNLTPDILNCPCLPGCVDMQIEQIVKTGPLLWPETVAAVEMVMMQPPSERYKRNVVRGKLELVVSLGGVASLMVGASLLSFVEMFYYLTLRLCHGNARQWPTRHPTPDKHRGAGRMNRIQFLRHM